MWFAFGFITLLSFCVLSFWLRASARWAGEPGVAEGIPYASRIERNRLRRPHKLLIGLRSAESLEFTLKRETWVDRLFKGIGLADEFQVGRDEFDNAIYIVSDDAGLCRRLALSTELQGHILSLFGLKHAGCRARRLRCLFGRIWMEFALDGAFQPDSAHGVAREAVPHLGRIADLTAAVAADGSVPEDENRDPFVLRAILILSVSTALAVNGLLQLMRLVLSPLPHTLDMGRLVMFSAFGGFIALALLVAAVVNFLGRSSRAHMVLLEVLLMGGFGCFMSVGAALRDYNMEWDAGAQTPYQAPVLAKSVSRGKSTSYYLHVPDRARPGQTDRLQVPAGFYASTPERGLITIHERPGALGMAWVDRLANERGEVAQ